MNWIQRLKQKWGITSNLRFAIIFFVFGITGSSTVFVRKPIFELLGITADTSMFIKVPLYLLIIVPAYQVLLLFYGTIFGQFRFFWDFEKKMFSRFKKKKSI